MVLTFQVLCNAALYSIRLYSHHQTHPQQGEVSAVAQPLHSFWSYLSSRHHSSTLDAYWLGGGYPSCLSVMYLLLFILFMGFSRQEYWSGLSFLSPVDRILSEVSTVTRPTWGPYTAGLIASELHKSVIQVIILVSFLWLWVFVLEAVELQFLLLLFALWWIPPYPLKTLKIHEITPTL